MKTTPLFYRNNLSYIMAILTIGLCFVLNVQVTNAQEETLDDLLDMSLDEYLNYSDVIYSDINKNKGGTGSISNSLQQLTENLDSKINLNGYYSINYDQPLYEDGVSTFDLHYFSLFFSAKFTERLTAELQLAHEHAGEKVWPRTALIDYKIHDAFIIRSGLFLIPSGDFNEYYDIDFINKMADRPYPCKEIAPSGWLDVGVQVRGKLNIIDDFVPYYSLYIVNGSLQGDPGGRIRKMRGNWLDEENTNKAVGGNVGAIIMKDLSASVSYYTGKYTDDGKHDLSIGGASLSYQKKNLTLFSEYQMAIQEYDTDTLGNIGTLDKNGFYALAGYKILKKIEPVVRYDWLYLDGDEEDNLSRITIGVNYHFNRVCILKINYEMIKNDGDDEDDNMLLLQFATMF